MLLLRYLFIFTSLLIAVKVLSCSCHNDIEEMNIARFNEASAVFTAKVDSIGECMEVKTIMFSPIKVFKGELTSKVIVRDIICTGSCAFSFDKEETYLVYLHADSQGNFKILPCTGTRMILTEKEIQNEYKQAERFKTTEYLKHEVEKWNHEMAFLEKMLALKTGSIHTYYINGKPTGEGKYKKGLPEGEWKYFYPDGNLKAVGYYKNGKKTGYWIEYTTYYATYQDTTSQQRKKYLIRSSGHYEAGFKEGKWEKVNLDGSVQTLFYKGGKFISEKAPQSN